MKSPPGAHTVPALQTQDLNLICQAPIYILACCCPHTSPLSSLHLEDAGIYPMVRLLLKLPPLTSLREMGGSLKSFISTPPLAPKLLPEQLIFPSFPTVPVSLPSLLDS